MTVVIFFKIVFKFKETHQALLKRKGQSPKVTWFAVVELTGGQIKENNGCTFGSDKNRESRPFAQVNIKR